MVILLWAYTITSTFLSKDFIKKFSLFLDISISCAYFYPRRISMDNKGRFSQMLTPSILVPTIVMAMLALVLVLVGYYRGEGQHITGLKAGANMTVIIIPLLVFAFIVAGMIQVIIPQEALSKWIGAESGLRGIILGTVAGAFAPGGPYVLMPLVAGLLKSGAGVGTMVAFLTGWSLWAFSRLPLEFGILGWKFTLIRLACTFFFPPIAGLIGQLLFGGVKTL
jgi:uncharacterized membrane protein YraQ (UPF0718 family)